MIHVIALNILSRRVIKSSFTVSLKEPRNVGVKRSIREVWGEIWDSSLWGMVNSSEEGRGGPTDKGSRLSDHHC